jgi:predicted amidophosphoribosyltransferase
MLPLASDLLDLVLPSLCVGCRAPDRDGWCDRCRSGLELRSCGPGSGLPVLAAGEYSGPLRQAILAYKERGQRRLAPALGRLLRFVLDAHRVRVPSRTGQAVGLVVVPVPSARAAARERGGDHMLRLARQAVLGGSRQSDSVAPVLRLTSTGPDSAGLSAVQRGENVRGRIAAQRSPHPGEQRRVILVDDIVTSGSTLLECRRALFEAGWDVAGAAVLAETVLRRGRGAGAPDRRPDLVSDSGQFQLGRRAGEV